MSEETTLYCPTWLRERLGRVHQERAHDPTREPLYRTIDVALDNLENDEDR